MKKALFKLFPRENTHSVKKTQNATATVASGLAATQTGSAHQRPSSCSVYLGAR